MAAVIKKIFFPHLLVLLFTASAGVQAASLSDIYLDDTGDSAGIPAFNKLMVAAPSIGETREEQLKIEYLLARMGDSSHDFIRNGDTFDGDKAAQFMRWKYFKHRKEIHTARDFVEKITNGSRKSGEPYWIRLSNGKCVEAKGVLMNELNFLEAALLTAKHSKKPIAG